MYSWIILLFYYQTTLNEGGSGLGGEEVQRGPKVKRRMPELSRFSVVDDAHVGSKSYPQTGVHELFNIVSALRASLLLMITMDYCWRRFDFLAT